jgi:hypothetical protein
LGVASGRKNKKKCEHDTNFLNSCNNVSFCNLFFTGLIGFNSHTKY